MNLCDLLKRTDDITFPYQGKAGSDLKTQTIVRVYECVFVCVCTCAKALLTFDFEACVLPTLKFRSLSPQNNSYEQLDLDFVMEKHLEHYFCFHWRKSFSQKAKLMTLRQSEAGV